jgi:S1-C subfamily serine protease
MPYRLTFAALLVLAGSGCAGLADDPPATKAPPPPPAIATVSADVPAAIRTPIRRLARDSGQRRAREATVRVRNIGCAGVATGSGFALAPDILVTNRHVLAGADRLQISTARGETLDVTFAAVGTLGDLGLVVVDRQLPATATYGSAPNPGDVVTAVGYPLGGELTLSPGIVVDRVDGSTLGIPGTVMRLTADIQPGNSGGPVFDRRGRIGGIVYAIELATGFGLAIPVDTLRNLIRAGGYQGVPACGSD